MYGDSQGSPGQDSHFDPLEEPATGAGAQTNVLAPMDVKVAGPNPWSDNEMGPGGEMGRDEPPAPPARGGFSLPGGAARIGIIAGAAALAIGVAGAGAFALTGGSDGAKKATVVPTQAALADPQNSASTQASADDAARKLMLDRASRAARGDAKKGPPLMAKGASPSASPSSSSGGAPSAGNPVPAGEAQTLAKSLMSAQGWNPSTQFGCLVNMWNKESGWRTTAGSPGGPYGIPQANPGTKMASAGSDWKTSARTQIIWGFGYIKGRYSTPCGAWSFWQGHHWY